jgi:tetraacyldisaccharide 4'-kinase
MVTPVSALSARFHDLVSGRAAGIGPSFLRLGLSAASMPYAWAVNVRNRWYDRGWLAARQAPVPVISVGNLTAGGTGKTPCVEYLAKFFRDLGMRAVILSRGYGAAHGANDEAALLKSNLPDVVHLQGADRAALSRIAVAEHEADILILDDGFQHRRLARDLDLVLIDATNPWGHGRMIPRGLLREPLAALRRASAILLTRTDQVSRTDIEDIVRRVRQEISDAPIVWTMHQPLAWIQHEGPERPVGSLRGKEVAALCGVGNPRAFRRTLEDAGCKVVAFRAFRDHHWYSRGDIVDLIDWARLQPVDAIVTTQKDLVKLQSTTMGDRNLFALRIGLRLRDGSEATRFHEQLRKLMAA